MKSKVIDLGKKRKEKNKTCECVDRNCLMQSPRFKLFIELRHKLQNKTLPRERMVKIMKLLVNFPSPSLAGSDLKLNALDDTTPQLNNIKAGIQNPDLICDTISSEIIRGWNDGTLTEGDIASLARTLKAWHKIDLKDL